MSDLRFRLGSLAAAAFGVCSFDARALSLTDLMAAVPAPPKTTAAAIAAMSKSQVVDPDYLRFKQAMDAERASVLALNGGVTPPEMGSPLSADIADTPEVQTAIRGYDAYLAANSGATDPKAALAKRTRWLQAALGQQLAQLLGKMKPCDIPCTDPAAIAQNQPLLGARDEVQEHELRIWDSLFQDWKKTRGPLVAAAQAQIAATADGAKATTPAGKAAIAQYRAAMLREIDLTLSITDLTYKRSDIISRGIVDGVSGSTYKPKKS